MTDMTAEQAITELASIAGSVAPDNSPHMDHIAMLADKALTAPRVPDVGSRVMNECAWSFIEAMPDGVDRGNALTSTWLKPALHAAITKLLTAAPAPAVQGEPVAEEITLFECDNCNHLYQDPVTRCDCMRMPDKQKYNRWLARPERAEQQSGTNSDKYRAELYDEMWNKAKDMGYGNVINALIELERLKQQPEPDVSVLVEALEEIVHPIRFMRERLEEGEQLNDMLAVELAKDASYLRGIAEAALAVHHKQQKTGHEM